MIGSFRMTIKSYNFFPVEKYLMSNTYYIPDYQREYSWLDEEQILDFWIDLIDTVENSRESHFFGQIVVHEEIQTRKKYVIDGQQRTSTSVIFMAVMRRLFDEIYNETKKESARNKAEDIRISILGRWSEEENDLKFHMGKVDNEFFRNYVQREEPFPVKVVESSHKRIKEAYNFFYNKLTQIISNFDGIEKYDELLKYYKGFKDHFTIMFVETDDINEAFIIFETLNARGKDLETSDLLKNHLFKSAGSQIEDVKNKWLHMQSHSEGVDLTKFIRTFWNSKYTFTREKDLYKNLKNIVTNPEQCVKFTNELSSNLNIYKVLTNPYSEKYFDDYEIEAHIDNLRILGARTYYPVIIAMINEEYLESELKEIIIAIESLILRNCVIAGIGANTYEILFAKLAKKITDEHITTKEILNNLKPTLLSDIEFKKYFADAEIKKPPVAKLILRCIENYQQKEIIINPDGKKVHLEHIMPQTLGNWNITDEVHQKYLNRLGNLTLLMDEFNKSIKNKVIKEKVEVYSTSKIEMTRALAKNSEWTEKSILERQLKLFEVAKKVWPEIK